MFTDQPTPFDIKFRFLGFPCVIGGLFWVGSILLSGISLNNRDSLLLLLMWILAVLISIMVHELGHAIAARYFGRKVILVKLTMMGGYCSYDREPDSYWKRIGISLAGPGAGFLLAAILKLLDFQFGLQSKLPFEPLNFYRFYDYLLFINIVWGVFNLLPILPMDGGRVCESLCSIMEVREPRIRARWISVIVAAALSLFVFAYVSGNLPISWYEKLPYLPISYFMGIFFAIFAVQNYQEIAAMRSIDSNWDFNHDDDEGEEWKRR